MQSDRGAPVVEEGQLYDLTQHLARWMPRHEMLLNEPLRAAVGEHEQGDQRPEDACLA
jgi:hypothetical protein